MTSLTKMAGPALTIPPRFRPAGVAAGIAITIVLVLLHWYAAVQTNTSPQDLLEGWRGLWNFLFGVDRTYPNGKTVHQDGAFPLDLRWAETIRPGLEYCLLTIWIGLLGTTLSIPVALFFAVISSRTTNRFVPLWLVGRGVMSVLRAVPETVYALMFIAAVGFGAFPGVIALAIHNVAVMGKLWSESMDEVDQGPVEALRVAGASPTQSAVHAVLPAVMPSLLGLLLYRFDTNVRSSVILGTVGAGGIGFFIKTEVDSFHFDTMMTYVCMVVVLIIVIDLFSAWLRRKVGTV
ncbi:phosphonate ABC transporter, permease protein PhnE [Nocardioides sp. CCNWLW239]|uniref:phosphonate ABC transporter, permease protein PhnE n=1 Tax=Nocardioides sp. CCNWLW239 TaxID=3128902 RepID=UPI0030169558